ncbi:MAG: hypothetical protein R6X02_22155 [Enhygromyxa sp.]
MEIFAACELAVLSRPGVRLELHGYADQPDKELSNLILSRNRAMSVYNVLKNILEDEMPTGEIGEVPQESVEAKTAKKIEGDDGKESYVITDPSIDRVVIRGHGEPGGGANSSKSGYDSSFRRVEVHVSGVVSLQLRRKNDM